MKDMKPALNIAVSAARAAGQIILRSLNRVSELKVHAKGLNDFVSEVDHYAEQEIISTIQKAYPSHSILAEESGEQKGDEFEWIIDPLDGTTNFTHGIPVYAISVALLKRGQLVLGVVYEINRDECFHAIKRNYHI